MNTTAGIIEKVAKINAFSEDHSAHRYQGIAFFDEELDLLDLAIRGRSGRFREFGASSRMKPKPKSACKKVRYRSRKDALQALQKVKASRDRQIQFGRHFAKVESRVYRCRVCSHGYHLTSRPYAGNQKPAVVVRLRKPAGPRELVVEALHVA
jgi:hypothetical protein